MKTSIIVPVYNAQKTIEGCVNSLLNQSVALSEYEVILVNDGSTDDTIEIIQSIIDRNQEADLNFMTIPNSGPARARNLGVKQARHDIILMTDSDCQVMENWIETMVSSFEDKDIVAVKGRYRTNQSEEVAKLVQAEFETKYQVLDTFDSIDFVDTYSAGYRKKIFNEMSGFDETYPEPCTEDIDLSFRMYQMGYKLGFNNNAVVFHVHPDSFSTIFKKKRKFAYWRLYTNLKLGKFKDTRTDFATKSQLLLLPLTVLVLVTIPIFNLAVYLFIGLVFLYLSLSRKLFAAYRKLTTKNFMYAYLLYAMYAYVRTLGQLSGIAKFILRKR